MDESNNSMQPDIKHLAWAIEQRAEIQRTLLALLRFARAHPSFAMEEKYLFDHLVGAAFSLWRAAFLAQAIREDSNIHESQEKFLEKIISDNMITFGDDKLNRHWTVGYYLDGSGKTFTTPSE